MALELHFSWTPLLDMALLEQVTSSLSLRFPIYVRGSWGSLHCVVLVRVYKLYGKQLAQSQEHD